MIALAVALVLFMFWERTMNALRPLARYIGILAIFQDAGRGGSSAVSYAWWRLVMMQVWYMLQSMSRFADSQNINFPDPFSTFVRVTNLIKLDIGIMPSTACVVTYDFYDIMMMWSLLPLVVVGIGALRVAFLMLQLAAATRLRKPSAIDKTSSSSNDNDKVTPLGGKPVLQRTESRADRADQRKFDRGVEGATASAMLVVCIFHSSVCAAVIDFFNCDPPSGQNGYETAPGGVQNSFLIKDYSISCKSDKYTAYAPYASIMLFIYAVMFPCILAYYVRKQRASSTTAAGIAGPLSFLTGHLRARTWWYEIVALDVRLLLGGALNPLIQHAGLHITIVMMIMLGFLIATRDINPYLNRAGGSLRTGTRPTLTLLLLLLLRTYV
jgi:hypothetical protein